MSKSYLRVCRKSNQHVPKGQKFIAQGKRSDALGYGGHWAFSPRNLPLTLLHGEMNIYELLANEKDCA